MLINITKLNKRGKKPTYVRDDAYLFVCRILMFQPNTS